MSHHIAPMLRVEAGYVPAHVVRAGVRVLPLRRARRSDLMPLFERTYSAQAGTWWTRWRLFFMSVADGFGYDDGQRWWVSHDPSEQRA